MTRSHNRTTLLNGPHFKMLVISGADETDQLELSTGGRDAKRYSYSGNYFAVFNIYRLDIQIRYRYDYIAID